MPRIRITLNDLNATVHLLNSLTGNPITGWVTQADGTNFAQVGHYGIESAYGGVKLVQIVNPAGGCREPLGSGFTTKRILYGNIHAMIAGIRSEQARTA